MLSHVERPYHVAIVGSGPSGFFAAASLLKAADASDDIDMAIDMLEMLPTPWGLVRSGVAPDHPKIKSISKQFEKTADDPRFRFFGNVVVGEHVEAAELAEHYDADWSKLWWVRAHLVRRSAHEVSLPLLEESEEALRDKYTQYRGTEFAALLLFDVRNLVGWVAFESQTEEMDPLM